VRKTPAQELSRLWRNRAKHLNGRARMYQAEGHLTPGDLREIVRRDGSCCVYCNLELDYEQPKNGGVTTTTSASFDHIIRLCDGGSNTYENVVCACQGCNQRNGKKSIENPVEAALERLRWFLARKPGARGAA
jgi:5-methylcytosine-specific restriction endonuclease McrA